MNLAYLTLEKLLKRYEYLQNKLEKLDIPKIYPRLDVQKRRKMNQFFRYVQNPETKEVVRKYIQADEIAYAQQLAQDQYWHKMNRLVEKRVKQLGALLRDYEVDEVDNVFTQLHEAKRELIRPIVPTRERLLAQWREREYSAKGFDFDSLIILTERGERVRSKSEKIMADLFDKYEVAYKYECPLTLSNRMTIYPDFTFLDTRRNEEIYWEHFGMMDEPSYAVNACKKIDLYEENGLYLGDRLIATFESSKRNLSYGRVEDLIKRYLL